MSSAPGVGDRKGSRGEQNEEFSEITNREIENREINKEIMKSNYHTKSQFGDQKLEFNSPALPFSLSPALH